MSYRHHPQHHVRAVRDGTAKVRLRRATRPEPGLPDVPVVLPLHPEDPRPHRKARVAELHDLWLRAGCRDSVMLMLLDYRHGKYTTEPEIPPMPPEKVRTRYKRKWCHVCLGLTELDHTHPPQEA